MRSASPASEPPRSARERALEILRRVEERGAFATPLLERHESQLLDPRDAALLHDLVLGVLRWQGLLDHAIARVASRPPAAMEAGVRRILRLGAYSLLFLDRVPAFAAVDSAVDLARDAEPRARGFVNAALRAVAREGRALLPGRPRPGDVPALAVRLSHPEWWTRRAVERLGWESAVALMEANNRPAPTVLRPNLGRTTPRDLELRLAAEGVSTAPAVFVPEARRVVAGAPQRTRTFREGYAWIQDEASQLTARLFGRVLRPRVADLCAAPGMKALELAESIPVGGAVVALDLRASRMRRLRENAARLGARGIVPIVADAASRPPPLRGRFDHVLVDAPCSGTGTLRRHPEIRWRLRPRDLRALARRQAAILENAAPLVAADGDLVYAVCSLEPEEGEGVVAAFLERHSEFEVADPRPGLPRPARRLVGEDGALRTSPVDGLDGFFGVLLRRLR